MSSKLEYKKLEGSLADYLNKHLTNIFCGGYLSCNNFVMPENFLHFGDQIQEMKIRSDDIWLCSFPKTGTTWSQEIIWCIVNDVNLEKAQEQQIVDRFPFLERSAWVDQKRVMAENPGKNLTEYGFNLDFELDSVKYINEMPSPRLIQTHLPFQLLPEMLREHSTSTKIIYTMRHPADTCISYYHFLNLYDGYEDDLENFCELFIQGMICPAPFWNHVLGYWEQRHNPNLLIIKYEDMKKDLRSVVYKIANFLSKSLNEEQIDKLCNHVLFQNMKKNPAVNYEDEVRYFQEINNIQKENGCFIRQGNSGGWRETMSSAMVEKFDRWTEEHLEGTGLIF